MRRRRLGFGTKAQSTLHRPRKAIHLLLQAMLVGRGRQPPGNPANRLPLHCEADQQGIMTFDGELVDISHGGIGFVTSDSGITLVPGTVLTGTRIQRPGKPTLIVDLEVRYSKPVLLANGQGAHRSGCVFLNPTREIAELIESFSEKRGSRKD